MAEKAGIGSQYVNRLNDFLRANAGDDANELTINPDTMGPHFEAVIKQCQEKGLPIDDFQPILLAATLKIAADLKEKKTRWPSQYFVNESVQLGVLGSISRYIGEHPKVKEEYRKSKTGLK